MENKIYMDKLAKILTVVIISGCVTMGVLSWVMGDSPLGWSYAFCGWLTVFIHEI